MLRVSVNMRLMKQKPFLKALFDSLEFSRFGQTGKISFSRVMTAEVDKVVIETLNDLMLPAIRQNLVKNKSIFTWTLHNSLGFSSDKPGRVVLDADKSGSGAREYVRILESGGPRGTRVARPIGSAEAGNIARWVSTKRKVDAKAAKSAAAHVIKKIETVGSKPHPFIQPAFELMMPSVKDVIHQRLAEVLGAR